MTLGRSKRAATDDGSWKRMLSARPVHNMAARVDELDGPSTSPGSDAVVVYVKNVRPWYMLPPLSWIVPHRRERRVVLDRVGSQMWRQCDGERTVEAVIDAFAATHDLTFHEARVAVTTYIKSLVKRGVLVIVMPKEQAG